MGKNLGRKLSFSEYDRLNKAQLKKDFQEFKEQAKREKEEKRRKEEELIAQREREKQEAKEQLKKEVEQYIQKLKDGNYPNVPIRLAGNEKPYYQVYSTWQELRTKHHSVSYGHLQQNIKITDWLSFNVGNITPTTYTTEDLEIIDFGDFFLTNKKVLFVGKNTQKIDLSEILKFEYDGMDLTIVKEGKNAIIPMKEKDAAIILSIIDNIDKGEL
ncbi:MAG: hypothetical protein LBC08_02725 [Campylobacteraceae bacterium]|jgi:hypothetical protein|nr:hypothetical protein [Campylobacteraceae bacterium]